MVILALNIIVQTLDRQRQSLKSLYVFFRIIKKFVLLLPEFPLFLILKVSLNLLLFYVLDLKRRIVSENFVLSLLS